MALRDANFGDTPGMLQARAGALESTLQRYRNIRGDTDVYELGGEVTVGSVREAVTLTLTLIGR